MKKTFILAATIMMAAATYAETSNSISPFETVNVNVPAIVRLVSGDSYSVNVRSTNAYDEQAVRYSVEDGVLRITSIDDATTAAPMCITIVSPSEPQLSLGRSVEAKN